VFQTNGSGWLSLSTETDGDTSVSCANGDLSDCFSGERYADVVYSQPPTQPGWTESAAVPEPSGIALEALGGLSCSSATASNRDRPGFADPLPLITGRVENSSAAGLPELLSFF
jgi:hypothetical protein